MNTDLTSYNSGLRRSKKKKTDTNNTNDIFWRINRPKYSRALSK